MIDIEAVDDETFEVRVKGRTSTTHTVTLRGDYYQKLTALSASNETNWFTDNAPDLLLFGCLLAAVPFVGDDARAPMWQAQYSAVLRDVMNQDDGRRFPAKQTLRQVAG